MYPTIAHNLWRYYDAVGVVADHWDDLKRYVGFLEGEYHRTGLKAYFCKFGGALCLAESNAVAHKHFITNRLPLQ